MSRYHTIVIGAGQAGLASGYYLSRLGVDFVILDGNERVGDPWRKRWDSMRLFTPARYNHLPGMAFPGPEDRLPHKDEVADFLEDYAGQYDLPVQLDTFVASLTRQGEMYRVETERGEKDEARNIIVATGSFQQPRMPPFAADLDDSILQLHSSEYRNPEQLQEGAALVVGAGNSGTQIALELAKTRRVWLSGPDTGRLPRTFLGRDIYRWIWNTLLHIPSDSWLGSRLVEKAASGGDPLVGIQPERVQQAGIERVARTAGVRDGQPVLADGRTFDIANVIWATGFVPDYSWIHLPVFREDGYPEHERGVVVEEPGLHFMGLRFQHRAKSSLIGGVGPDAKYIVDQIAARSQRETRVKTSPAQASRKVKV